MEKQCSRCGGYFRIKPSHAPKRVHCSRDCMARHYRESLRGSRNPNYRNAGIQKCQRCAKEFQSYNQRSYCSRACYNDVKRERSRRQERGHQAPRKMPKRGLSKECKQCHTKISANLVYCKACSPHGKRSKTTICGVCRKPFKHPLSVKRVYCSKPCFDKARIGEGNGNWKGGITSLAKRIRDSKKNRALIRRILKRDFYTCQICGQVGWKLEVDHLRPFSEILREFVALHPSLDANLFSYELSLIALKHQPFWDKSNLRVLCQSCNRTRARTERF